MTLRCTMVLGDCLDVMPELSDLNAQTVFADVPFVRTDNYWDNAINMKNLWPLLWRASHKRAAICMAATMPFGADLIYSQRELFRYDLVWTKTCMTGFFNSAKMPLRSHESVLVFYNKLPVYNAQKTPAKKLQTKIRSSPREKKGNWQGKDYTTEDGRRSGPWVESGLRFPGSVISCTSIKKQKSLHPTQKPLALLDWLIRTYSNTGDNVLDPCSGSGTTAVAALACGRNVVCIEKDTGYFEASVERVKKAVVDGGTDAQIEVRR